MIGKIIRAAKKIRHNPRQIVLYGLKLGGRILPDKWFLQARWWAVTGQQLNLEKPQGFNEKIQWLILYNRRPEYTQLADKYLVREFVAKTIGKEYLVPLLGVWKRAEEIDFNALPEQFVLKCTHNSGGGMYVCKDKHKMEVHSVVKKLKQALKKNYYFNQREWVYKYISPHIIAETLLVDKAPANPLGTLIDYKFYCFNGEPRFLYVGADDVSKGVKGELYLSVLDLEWKPTPFGRPDHKPLPVSMERPAQFERMLEIARKLSKNIPFVRVDLYWVNGQIFFSEMTFYPGAGLGFFSPIAWEQKIGSWLKLPVKTV